MNSDFQELYTADKPQELDYLTITEINRRLAVVKVDAPMLERMGFMALSGKDIAKGITDADVALKIRGGKLYPVADFPRIRAAIAAHMQCASGDSFQVGDLMKNAPNMLPSGYGVTLTADPSGVRLYLNYPDTPNPVLVERRPLGECIKTAIACAQADAVNKEQDQA